jgi:uncharacterized protein (UPF0261 family)
MINFGRPETVPARFADRVIHAHNSDITLVRTSPAEAAELGRRLLERVSGQPADAAAGPPGPPVILLPSGGLSAIDVEGHRFHDAKADRELLNAIRSAADPDRVRIVDVTGNIDCPEVGLLAAGLLHELIVTRSGGQECTQ